MKNHNANARTTIPAIPPTTPPTIAPVLLEADGDEFGLNGDDVKVDGAEGVKVAEGVDVEGDVEANLPLSRKSPFRFVQQSLPLRKSISPEHKLPSPH